MIDVNKSTHNCMIVSDSGAVAVSQIWNGPSWVRRASSAEATNELALSRKL